MISNVMIEGRMLVDFVATVVFFGLRFYGLPLSLTTSIIDKEESSYVEVPHAIHSREESRRIL